MAKKASESVNKSQMIRDYMKENPQAKPLEVATAMQEQGFQVTAQFVSTVKSNAKKSTKTGRRGRPAGSTKKPAAKATGGAKAATKVKSSEVTLDSLLNAKKLVQEMGGIEQARSALTVLEQLTD